MAGKFTGWPEQAQRFFIGLEHDNSKPYFESHRDSYMKFVRAPMEALLADLEDEFGPAKIFRINRDIRFSTDKTPYKTNIAAVAGGEGKGGYLSFSSKGLYVGTGRHQMEKPELDAFRRAVADLRSGPELARVVDQLEGSGYDVGYEELKVVPQGYPRDHERARFLRHKGLGVGKDFGLQPWLGTPATRDRVAQVWRDAQPMLDWLSRNVPHAEPVAG